MPVVPLIPPAVEPGESLMRCTSALTFLALIVGFAPLVADEPKPPKELAAIKYRQVGPFAGGRVSRSGGVTGDP